MILSVFVYILLSGDRPMSQRTGLRERRSVNAVRSTEPTVTETWTPEEDIDFCKIKEFAERLVCVA